MPAVKVFDYQFSLWWGGRYLVKLKNGVYAFSEALKTLRPEEAAGALYQPSYISMEKALSIHGLIPEIVYAFTSVTPKTTRRFKNQLGEFIFRHIKPSLFFSYRQVRGLTRSYLLADPEKALLDLLYLNWIRTKDSLDALRINWRQFKATADRNKITRYARKFGQAIEAEVLAATKENAHA